MGGKVSKFFNNGDLYANVAFALFAVHIGMTRGVASAVLFLAWFCLAWGAMAAIVSAAGRASHE